MSGAVTAVAVGGAATAMGVGTAAAIGAGLAAGNMVATQKSAKKQRELIKQGNAQSLQSAKQAQAQQEQAFNASNQKQPDISGILAQNTTSGGGAGPSSTMLTGGINYDQLALGRTSLLGA